MRGRPRGAPREGTTIMKLITNTQITVDGVMQANGGNNPEFDPGFDRGGWALPLGEAESVTYIGDVFIDEFFADQPRDSRREMRLIALRLARQCPPSNDFTAWIIATMTFCASP